MYTKRTEKMPYSRYIIEHSKKNIQKKRQKKCNYLPLNIKQLFDINIFNEIDKLCSFHK